MCSSDLDLFILSLLASTTLGLLWAFFGARPGVLFALYLMATAVLFGGVPWSKFAHMFFKPAAAFEKRVAQANGGHNNLPFQTRDDPEQRARHSMELLRDAPCFSTSLASRPLSRHAGTKAAISPDPIATAAVKATTCPSTWTSCQRGSEVPSAASMPCTA